MESISRVRLRSITSLYLKALLVIPVVIFVSVSNKVFADVTETGIIEEIIVESHTQVSIFLDGTDDASECSGGRRWTLKVSDPIRKEKLAALLSAASQGKTVRLFHLSGWGCGNWNSNQVYYVDVNY